MNTKPTVSTDEESRARRMQNFAVRAEPSREPDFEGQKTVYVTYNGRQEYPTTLAPHEARKLYDLLAAEFGFAPPVAELAAAQRHTYASIANSLIGKHKDDQHTEYVTLADAEAAVRAARPEQDRKSILLRAAYDLLAKQNDSRYVLNLLTETARWDDADCDGYCLMEEIADELGLDDGDEARPA